jgi:PPOX class probable F420-dependent enzyme
VTVPAGDRCLGYHPGMAHPKPIETDPSTLVSARDLLSSGLRFVTIASIARDGGPHQAVAWFTFRDEVVVLNSAEGRAWPTNLRRDPRVSLTVEDQYRWLSIRGVVSIVEDQPTAHADIAEMARRYYAADPAKAERVIRDQFERQDRVSFHLPLAGSRLHFEE